MDLSTRRRRAGTRGLSIALFLAALAPLGALTASGPPPRAPTTTDRATAGQAADQAASRAAGQAVGAPAAWTWWAAPAGSPTLGFATRPCPDTMLRVTHVPFVIDMTECDPRSALLKGPNGLGAVVPADGSSVAASILGGRGMRSMVVRVDLDRKRVTVSGEEPGGSPGAFPDNRAGLASNRLSALRTPEPTPFPSPSLPAVAPLSACKDAAYRRDGAPLPSRRHRRPILKWWYYPGTGPVPGLSPKQRMSAFTRGTLIALQGRNNCHLGRIAIRQKFKGYTWRPPGVMSSGACGMADGRNVRGWMRFDMGEAMLGLTCKWFRRGKMIEGDVALNANRVRWTTSSKRCRGNTYDAVGVAAHENLHHLGLAHVEGARHRKLTMFPAIDTCEFHWRTLGLGDFLGLKRSYGAR